MMLLSDEKAYLIPFFSKYCNHAVPPLSEVYIVQDESCPITSSVQCLMELSKKIHIANMYRICTSLTTFAYPKAIYFPKMWTGSPHVYPKVNIRSPIRVEGSIDISTTNILLQKGNLLDIYTIEFHSYLMFFNSLLITSFFFFFLLPLPLLPCPFELATGLPHCEKKNHLVERTNLEREIKVNKNFEKEKSEKLCHFAVLY